MVLDLIQRVEAIAGQRVLVVGDWMLDRYVYGDAERVSPEAPVPVLRIVEREERAGGSGSVAANLVALGASVTCCGVIGDDPAGRSLVDALRHMGANVDGLLTVADRPTTTKTRVVGLAQHRHRQQLIRIDEEKRDGLDERTCDRLIDFLRRNLPDHALVCLQDYAKGVISDLCAPRIIAECRAARKPVLADPALISSYERYRGVTVITPNRNEFRLLAGRAMDSLDEIGRAAREFSEQLDMNAILVTLDRDGSILARAGAEPLHVPTKVRTVYDNTGAGDAVLAMLAAAVAAGADLAEAARLANVAGGLEVEKFGCVPILAEEIVADLRLDHHARIGKLRTPDELAAEITLRRDRGQKIVFTNGCFDLLHPGHVDYLARCRAFGEVLVVALNSDRSVRSLNKGDNRPYFNQNERARMLAALADVDYVVVFDEPTPEALIRRLRPDVLVKGEDWAGKGIAGRDAVEAAGGRVELLPLVPGYSTTLLAERIRGADAQP